MLNLVPWGGVEVDLRHLRFAGLHGWDALAQAALQSYIQDITANQARACRSCVLHGVHCLQASLCADRHVAPVVALQVESVPTYCAGGSN